jgi:UDP-N-acetylmuramate dehydrogenase
VRIIEEPTIVDTHRLRELGVEVEHDVALAPYTTIRIGGPADRFAVVTNTDQLVAIVRWARTIRLPYFVLGGGSNMLIGDAGIRGLVIYNRCRHIEFLPDESIDENASVIVDLHAESGAVMAGVARQSVQRGLSGLEWAVSLPGTVGGAVIGNAGAHGGEIKDNLVEAGIFKENNHIANMQVNNFDYAYRSSSLKRVRPLQAGFKAVILDARFRLQHADDAAAVRETADQYLAHRRRTQPVEPSLGSTFMNPPGDYAGRLIESAGLKGMRVGGAEISNVHANFIVNPGGVDAASAADVMRLVKQIQKEIRHLYDVKLIPEIQLAGQM